MKYQLIYADPPWTYRDTCNAGNRGAAHKYDLMTLADLQDMAIDQLAADDALLAMWWVPPMPMEAIALTESWGFSLKNMNGFTWHKQTTYGKNFFGMGHYTRANAECCLIATRGSPKVASHSVSQFVSAPIGRHSQKPDEVRARLVRLMGDVPRLELFARDRAPGWDVFGNQVEGSISIPVRRQLSLF